MDLDVLSKTDPMVVAFVSDSKSSGAYVEVGRTERIKNNLNPDFVTPITVDYRFEENQAIRLSVYVCMYVCMYVMVCVSHQLTLLP